MTSKQMLWRPAILASLCAAAVSAEVRLPSLFSSHMVLQREQPIHVWGWAEHDEHVTATFKSKTASTTADGYGRWDIYLQPEIASAEGAVLTVQGSNSITLEDVLVGDVWFASGQSNMEMPLSGFPGNAVVDNAEEEIRTANHPDIRLFVVAKRGSDYPQRDFEHAQWSVCRPESAAKFSAVAYFFGRKIAQDEKVPVGLIDSTWGGTPVESWVSLDALAADAQLLTTYATWTEMADRQADVPAMLSAEKRQDEVAKASNQPLPKHSWHPDPVSWMPTGLYNGMVAPAVNFRIKGVIWYQGETNSGRSRAALYEKLFPAMIRDWRTQWQEGMFPFLYVQISNFRSNDSEVWPVVREAQRRTLEVANTAMVVTTDIGNPDNVHPANKQEVGLRLALGANAIAYGKKLEYSGPLYRETSVENGAVRVWFTHDASGLVAKGGDLHGFEIAGSDKHFVAGEAKIDGKTVVVSSASVPAPKYVRYGWSNAVEINLFNDAGLPASPFTSEREIPHP